MVQFNYQGLSKSSGIYVIFNSHNWRLYVGSTVEFKNRWQQGHMRSLNGGKHSNKFLQADYNKCKALLGHDDFLEFHVLKHLPGSSRKERLTAEETWIKIHFDSGKNCYNLCDRAISREGSGSKNPEVTSAILSERTKAQWADPLKRALILKRQKEVLKPGHMDKALNVCWNGSGNEERRLAAGKRASERWKNNPNHVKHVLEAILAGRTSEVYTKKKQKYLETTLPDPTLVKEIKVFEGAKANKAKWVEANLVSPDGSVKYTKIFNMNDFARTINVSDPWKLLEVVSGKRVSYMGWTKAIY